jgi:serine/threonine protein phosphatase 1
MPNDHLLIEPDWQEGARMFVVGDIHGCHTMLMEELTKVGFDPGRGDRLFALGDLVDRGPDNLHVLDMLNLPWFASVMGNHEAMTIAAYGRSREAENAHVANGGGWFKDLDEDDRDAVMHLIVDLPIAMTVVSPSGRKIGLVHADAYGIDWDNFVWRLTNAEPRERSGLRNYAMWSRDMVGPVERGDSVLPMRGVDEVFYGHNVFADVQRRANQTWLDTGAGFRGRRMSVVQVE